MAVGITWKFSLWVCRFPNSQTPAEREQAKRSVACPLMNSLENALYTIFIFRSMLAFRLWAMRTGTPARFAISKGHVLSVFRWECTI